jgi:hypothetical protein
MARSSRRWRQAVRDDANDAQEMDRRGPGPTNRSGATAGGPAQWVYAYQRPELKDVALARLKKDVPPVPDGERACDDCAEKIQAAAVKCRFCGAAVAPPAAWGALFQRMQGSEVAMHAYWGALDADQQEYLQRLRKGAAVQTAAVKTNVAAAKPTVNAAAYVSTAPAAARASATPATGALYLPGKSQKKPQKHYSLVRSCITVITAFFGISLVVGIFSSGGGSGGSRSTSTAPPPPTKWYEGGTLHKVTSQDWHKASYCNRLATAADFIATAKVASNTTELRKRAEELAQCITEGTSGADLKALKVSEVAAACTILLGYTE